MLRQLRIVLLAVLGLHFLLLMLHLHVLLKLRLRVVTWVLTRLHSTLRVGVTSVS